MIASVEGVVAGHTADGVVVRVGGIGVAVHTTAPTRARLRVGEPALLATSLVVREDSLTIFGFLDEDEKQVFEIVQTASGVGPKVAQAIVAVMSPDDLRRAITTEDVKALTRVPGIGQKGAQRIILELKDRIGPPVGTHPSTAAQPAGAPWRDQVQQGLIGLGWSAKESEKAVEAVAPEAGDVPDVGALLRAALRTLSKA